MQVGMFLNWFSNTMRGKYSKISPDVQENVQK